MNLATKEKSVKMTMTVKQEMASSRALDERKGQFTLFLLIEY